MLDAVLVADDGLRPGELAAERNQLAPVGGAEGAAGEREVERLEQVGLAGAVWADQADDTLVQLDPRPVEAAQWPRFDGGDQHRDR